MKKAVYTKSAPEPVGPYNQAIVWNNLVFTAGQIAVDPASGNIVEGGVQEQTRQVLKNLEAVLKAAGSGLEYVIKTTVFLKNMDDFSAMNDVYATFFTDTPPARSAVEVARLPKDVLVEIECVAIIP